MPRVIHFEIPADDTGRAAKFYQKVFGWKIEKWGPMDYWLATTGPDSEPGINGAIMTRETQKTTVNTINVSSVDEYAKKAKGSIVTPPAEPTQDAVLAEHLACRYGAPLWKQPGKEMAYSKGGLRSIDPPYIVDIQLKTLIALGTATINVRKEKNHRAA